MIATQARPILSRKLIGEFSASKSEPAWMAELRLKACDSLEGEDFGAAVPHFRTRSRTESSHGQAPEALAPDGELARLGVTFTDMETALREQPEMMRRHFASIVGPGAGKFAALNTALWSGGSFIHVPKGVRLERPLQPPSGSRPSPFERTVIVAEEGAEVHCVTGCLTPAASDIRRRSTVVEVRALRGARVRCTTLQNWPAGVVSVATKRAVAHEGALVEWVDASFGPRRAENAPAVTLAGKGARAEVFAASFSGREGKAALQSQSGLAALDLDALDPERLFFLMARGLDRPAALALLVNGFFAPFTKELPLEYAVEFNRLIELELQGA